MMTDDIRDYGSLSLTCYAGETPLNIRYDSGYSNDMALLSLSSASPRLTLNVGLSHSAYAQATYPLQYTLLAYFAAAFLIALILSVIFTRMNMRPLDAVVAFISQLGIHTGTNSFYKSFNTVISPRQYRTDL